MFTKKRTFLIFCFAFFTGLTWAQDNAQTAAPAPITCEDAPLIDCTIPGICSDSSFAALLCPVTCGRCSNLVADCGSEQAVYCEDHPEVCSDVQLAVTVCPHMCGFCGTTTGTTAETTIGPSTPASDVRQCPTCFGTTHILNCLDNMQPCASNTQICKGSVDDWRLSMGCTSPLICQFEEIQSTRNCTSGDVFAPQEHCTFCCHGDECSRDLALIQEGLDLIPNVFHCPSCYDESDPRRCAQRVIPCGVGDNVCQITINSGLFTATCAKLDTCNTSGDNECGQSDGVCTSCCQTDECVTKALTVSSDISVPTNPNPTPTASVNPPTPTCFDADFYPCQFAQATACSDDDMSLNVCPVTCGRCDERS